MSDRELQTHLGEKFGAGVNYWDQLGKCDRIYHNYDKYPQGGWHRYSYYVTDNTHCITRTSGIFSYQLWFVYFLCSKLKAFIQMGHELFSQEEVDLITFMAL